jgi:hypothetical protein
MSRAHLVSLTTTRKDEFVMQIISTQKLCGYPVLEIRRLMRAGAGSLRLNPKPFGYETDSPLGPQRA